MPYVDQTARDRLAAGADPATEGELNFAVTQLCRRYLAAKGISYATINAVVGVLACTQAELYRRVAVPYEETKRQTNGDVY